ncbi:hypothetical protein AGMMS49938_12790 [Fibrobacterales bacterium]|nr:hypothetical protein AGMMS49938_12790 [Fibrobacterales bacterium]
MINIIKISEPNRVFTVGLFGNWGTGKSSIIETSKQDFDQQKIKFITYDAWQYVNDSFRRMFLRKLREDLKYEETDLMKKFYENESTDVGNKYQLSPTRLAFILGGLILFLAIVTFIPFCIDYKFPIYSIFTLLGLLITIISGAFHQLKMSVTKPHLFAPEQFEDCFKEIVSNSLSKPNKVLKWVKGDNSIQNLEKLVIVIDNIDRCSNDVAYNLLTDIKTFFSDVKYSIVFVIPVDDEALKKHIIQNSKNDTDCDKDKEEFLRKFFNVTIRIKPYAETDMYAFAKQICEKSGLNFKPETINVASKEYAKNPRRIIQLFNNLLAEMNYYDAEFAQNNETLICCALIIREEYQKYYNVIVNSPKIFNEDYTEKDENTKRFIRIVQANLGKVELSDLSKVLTNSYHQFDDIPADLKDAINTFGTEKVLSVWETEKDNIADYIFDRFNYAIKNNFIDNELVPLFDVLAQINTKFQIETHFAKKIDEKTFDFMPNIISKTKNHKNLCNYAMLREKQNYKKIKTTLIENCKRTEKQEKEKYWNSFFIAILKVFQDKETSIALSSTYTLYQQDIEYRNFSKDQIEYLISDEFVQQRISELPTDKTSKEISLDIKTDEYETVKWLFKNKKNIVAETYATLFAKIIGDDSSENRMKGKTIEEIANILKFVNPLLNLIPAGKLTTQPQTLYNLIVKDRQMLNPQYFNKNRNQNLPVEPPYYQSRNFIDECIASDTYIQDIIDFVINAYRVSNNNTDVSAEIDKLLKKTNLDTCFIELIDKRLSLNPLLNLIFDDDQNYEGKNNFKEANRLSLLKHCFIQKTEKNQYIISEDKAKSKLNELLAYAQKEKSSEVYTLLEALSEQELYKNLLTSLIIAKDSAFVNSLPKKLLTLAVNSFNKDNYKDYANNFDFLSVIMQHGKNNQKSYVVKILTAKLDDNIDIERVLNLIETMQNISSFDSNGVLHSHLGKYQEDNKATISTEMNEQIDKLKNKTKV